MYDIVTFGEPLILLTPTEVGLLRNVSLMRKSVVGAELNFAIGSSRLGMKVGWFGKVGNDEFGAQVEAVLRAEGVDASRVIRDPAAPTAVMFKQYRGFGDPSVLYYRRNSAASRITPGELDTAYIAESRCLHVSGITAAISETSRASVSRAVAAAKEAGVALAFDPNIRRKLMDEGQAREWLLPLADAADILLLGQDEGELLYGVQGAEAVLETARSRGPATVVVKMGAHGSLATNGAETIHQPAYPVSEVVDTVGAGDGFNAGFISGTLRGLDFQTSLRLGGLVGAGAVTVRGDWEGYPTWAEARSILGLGPSTFAR